MVMKRFTISESVVSAELGEEGVLLDVESGCYYGLDEIGSAIWRLIGKGLGESEICERLLAEYDVEPARLREDITEFLSPLETKSLIQRRPAA